MLLAPGQCSVGNGSNAIAVHIPDLALRAAAAAQVGIRVCQHINEFQAGISVLRMCVDTDHIVGVAIGTVVVVVDLGAGNIIRHIGGSPAGQITGRCNGIALINFRLLGGTVVADAVGVDQTTLIGGIVPFQTTVVHTVRGQDRLDGAVCHIFFQQIGQFLLVVALHTVPHYHASPVAGIGAGVQDRSVHGIAVVCRRHSRQHFLGNIQQIIHAGDLRAACFLIGLPVDLDSVALGGIRQLVTGSIVTNAHRHHIDAAGIVTAELADKVQRGFQTFIGLHMRHLVQIVIQIQQHSAVDHVIDIFCRDKHNIGQIAAGKDSIGLFIGICPDFHIETARSEVFAFETANKTAGQICITGIKSNGLGSGCGSIGAGRRSCGGAGSGACAAATGGETKCCCTNAGNLKEIASGNHTFHNLKSPFSSFYEPDVLDTHPNEYGRAINPLQRRPSVP